MMDEETTRPGGVVAPEHGFFLSGGGSSPVGWCGLQIKVLEWGYAPGCSDSFFYGFGSFDAWWRFWFHSFAEHGFWSFA